MSFPFRFFFRGWMIVPVLAAAFLVWMNAARIQHVQHVTNLVPTDAVLDARSPTGYAGGIRQLIVPEHNNASYQWIAQTQQMFASGTARIRHVGYDNAPLGREVYAASLYRWWLGAVAVVDHLTSGSSLGLAVERAALVADPAMHLLLLLSAVIFCSRYFGNFSAALVAAALAFAFPLAGSFLPAQPEDRALGVALALWSVLPLLAGIAAQPSRTATVGVDPKLAAERRSRRLFIVAGIAGGIGLWANVAGEVPVLVGIVFGAVAAAWCAARPRSTSQVSETTFAAPWLSWALAGAATVLVAYLFEFAPGDLGTLELRAVHPLYGIAWLGAGGVLLSLTRWVQRREPPRSFRAWGVVLWSILGISAIPVALMIWKVPGPFARDPFAVRLSNLPGSVVANSVGEWIFRDGLNLVIVSTLLPVSLLAVALWLIARSKPNRAACAPIALAIGPVAVALAFAFFQIRWWSTVDALLVALLGAATSAGVAATHTRRARWYWSVALALCLLPGLIRLIPKTSSGESNQVNEAELVSLVERDFSHWLANQAGESGAIVLAPPALTVSLFYHGGLRGLGTPYPENKDGFAASVRVAGATSPDEAQALARKREVTHIVMPSWDPFLDEYARLATNQPEHTLMALLHQWTPPRWLRAVPYRVPQMTGIEEQTVAVFEVVDVQDNVTALSKLAEYFVEMDLLDLASSLSAALKENFPGEPAAIIARARVDAGRHDAKAFAATLEEIVASVTGDADPAIAWDQRVSLALVLADGKRFDLAREQVRRCFADMDAARLRSLTTLSLYRLQVLAHVLKIEFEDARLRDVARKLLPVDLRAQLGAH